MASLINKVAHGLVAGDAFMLANILPTDSGVDESQIYFVLASGLTANAFQFSETSGGTAFVLTHPIDSGDVYDVDAYEVANDGIMDPPDLPATPSAPTLASSVFANIVQMKVTP